MLQKVSYATDGIINNLLGTQSNFRVELRTGAGQREFFVLKACTRSEALKEAEEIAYALSQAKRKSVLYRLPGGDWTLASGVSNKNKITAKVKNLLDKFFAIDDEGDN